MTLKKPLWWIKLTNFEYWSVWLFYLPTLPYGLYLALKARSLMYFTTLNPSMYLSGLTGDSKAATLNKIDKVYLPISILVYPNESFGQILEKLQQIGITFPMIAKPDDGERGTGVEKIDSIADLKTYLKQVRQNILLQEYLDYPLELGVMYHKMPSSGKSEITSIVKKEFLSVRGDGRSTLKELVDSSDRARFQKKRLEQKYVDDWNSIIPNRTTKLLEPIGNHCRGTKFLNGNYLLSEKVLEEFDKIAAKMDGFYSGRFDIKVSSEEDFVQGKNIKIIEVNGVASEPAHIYDPKNSLFSAYRDVFKHLRLVYDISQQNFARGAKRTSFKGFLKALRNKYSNRR